MGAYPGCLQEGFTTAVLAPVQLAAIYIWPPPMDGLPGQIRKDRKSVKRLSMFCINLLLLVIVIYLRLQNICPFVKCLLVFSEITLKCPCVCKPVEMLVHLLPSVVCHVSFDFIIHPCDPTFVNDLLFDMAM